MKFQIEAEKMSYNAKKAMPPATALKHGEGAASGYGPNGTTKHPMAPKTWVDFKGKPKGYDAKPFPVPPKGMMPMKE